MLRGGIAGFSFPLWFGSSGFVLGLYLRSLDWPPILEPSCVSYIHYLIINEVRGPTYLYGKLHVGL